MRIVRRIVLAALCVCLLLTGSVAESMETTETASQAVANMAAGWNLGNSLDSHGLGEATPEAQEIFWGNPVTTEVVFKALHEAGFGAVRIPVTWFENIDENNWVDPAWMDRVAEVVDMALAEGLYCVLNVHHDTGKEDSWLQADPANYEAISARFTLLWMQIATRFADYDGRLLFEAMNELTDAYGTSVSPGGTLVEKAGVYRVVDDLNQLFVDTVRQAGGQNAHRNLIISPYYASILPEVFAQMRMPEDSAQNHLIVSVHSYFPITFTFAGGYMGENDTVVDPQSYGTLDFYFRQLQERFVRRGIPVIIGEFGAVDKENTGQRIAYVRYMVSQMREIGGAWFWWDNGLASEFSLLDRESGEWLHPEIVDALVR